jgi:hypothetical protein
MKCTPSTSDTPQDKVLRSSVQGKCHNARDLVLVSLYEYVQQTATSRLITQFFLPLFPDCDYGTTLLLTPEYCQKAEYLNRRMNTVESCL